MSGRGRPPRARWRTSFCIINMVGDVLQLLLVDPNRSCAAWMCIRHGRLCPDLQVGIVHIKSDHYLDTVLALGSRTAANCVGASARFDSLREAPQALHFARMAMRASADRTAVVTTFDGSILATAAVSAPEVMIKLVNPTLDCFGELPAEQRDVLFQTFEAWLENDASISAAGEALFCHPNTVRHRLRRIEKQTGRSLSRPRDVAKLCLAFEVHRQLMH